MIIVEDFPPNYEQIKKVFSNLEERKPIFCYGEEIYNPFKIKITPDLQVHEEVHSKQQGFNPSGWWDEYLNNKEFRTEQEIMAYGTQLFFVKQSDIPKKKLAMYEEGLAYQLSDAIYGSVLTFNEAKTKIRLASKQLALLKAKKGV